MKQIKFFLVVLVFLSVFACSKGKSEQRNYPMFWTWLDYRPQLNFDSICAVIKETGLDGVILNAPTPADYRKAIPIAHKYGLEVYAWIWTMNPEHDRDEILDKHPEWLSVNRKGESLADIKAYVDYYKFMCPAIPEVREYIKKKIKSYCEIEGLNGIVIDYHRYVDVILPPTLWTRYGIVQDREYPEWDFGYHPTMISLFKEKYGYDPREQEDPSIDEKWLQFRCDQITEIANEIADVVHSYGKVMGASPFPTPAMARAMVRQDWGNWNLDIVFPMVYHNFYTGDVSFIEDCTIDNVKQKNSSTTLYCGMMAIDSDEMFECMDAALKNGAQGISMFTINALRSPEVRKKFRVYADSVRLLRASGKINSAVASHISPYTNPFEMEKIMNGVNMRIKAFLSLAKASNHPRIKKGWRELEQHAIDAMQVNNAEDYIKRLISPMNYNNKTSSSEIIIIVEQFESDNQSMNLNLSEYKLIDQYGAFKRYQVKEQNSNVLFNVTFYFYGGIFSGWSVEPDKISYEKYRKSV